MNLKNVTLLILFVLIVIYHVSYSRFYAGLKREKAIDLIPDEPMAKHFYTDLKALKFLVTRQYRGMGRKIEFWGDASLAFCLLGWICMAAFIYFANVEGVSGK